MANVPVKNATGSTEYLKASGAGSSGDPYIVSHNVDDVVPGTGATKLGKAEDAAHTSGDVGVMALAVRQDTPGATSGTDGDYEPLQVAGGRLWTSATVTAVVPGTAATNLGKAEDAAHTSGDVGVMALAVRTDVDTTALAGTDGDYVPVAADSTGRVKVNNAEERVVLDVTPTCDTSANDAGDVLFTTTSCGTVARVNGGVVVLESVTILDEDDQTAAAMTLYFLDTNTSIGTINAAPNISDANARKLLGTVPVASGDWVDVGGAKIATIRNIGLTMKADAASQVIYVAATCAGTPTQTASGIKLKLAFKRS